MLWLPRVRQLISSDAGLVGQRDSRTPASEHALRGLPVRRGRSLELERALTASDFLYLYKGP